MRKSFVGAGTIQLDSKSKLSLFQQIYDGIRSGILESRLKKGAALPSSRALAVQLGVSRMTVMNAYDQLLAEGYLTSHVGRGTFVSDELPEEKQLIRFQSSKPGRTAPQELARNTPRSMAKIRLSNRGKKIHGQALCGLHGPESLKPFCPGVPAIDEFPIETWKRISRQVAQSLSDSDLSYGSPVGYMPLRRAICDYVQAFRGVDCEPEQVMLVAGTQQAIEITARLLVDPGDEVLFEDPGYPTGRSAVLAAGAKIVAVPVDRNGAKVSEGFKKAKNPKLIYVTPSHQFPIGVTMSVERRMELIELARKQKAVIVEDDYDSEYRYAQRPIPALASLDHEGRTIYIGSFSKVLIPALGMGYVVVPKTMVSAYETALRITSRPPSMLIQKVILEFMSKGHFERHLRRMRKVHQERRSALVEAVETYLPDHLEIVGADAGLHCMAEILTKQRDSEVAERIERLGVIIRSLSTYAHTEPVRRKQNGLIFGFACSTPEQITSSVKAIRSAF